MFNEEIKKLLAEVISSWQVLAVTGVLIVYIFIVNNVARLYRRHYRRQPRNKAAAPAPSPSSETDELGLEEEIK